MKEKKFFLFPSLPAAYRSVWPTWSGMHDMVQNVTSQKDVSLVTNDMVSRHSADGFCTARCITILPVSCLLHSGRGLV